MTSIRELRQLQGLDTELSSRQRALEAIQSQLDDTEALEQLRVSAAEARRALSEVEKQQRPAEFEVETLREQVKGVEKKLYSGEVKIPKELVNIQEEVTSLKKRQSQLEEALLGVMNQLEEAQQRHNAISEELSQSEEERKSLEVRLSAERGQLETEVKELGKQRELLAGGVPPQDMRIYSSLLTTKQGRAVAAVERSMCQGCRLNMPLNIQQRLRANHGLVQCPSCNRILYLV